LEPEQVLAPGQVLERVQVLVPVPVLERVQALVPVPVPVLVPHNQQPLDSPSTQLPSTTIRFSFSLVFLHVLMYKIGNHNPTTTKLHPR
jgi:hypothetical protein